MKKRMFLLLTLSMLVITTACGFKNSSTPKNSQETNVTSSVESTVLKPGEEGFSFEPILPKNWEPESFIANNGTLIQEELQKMDEGKGDYPVESYYASAYKACLYAKIPDESFWNVNPDMPSLLYKLPVNVRPKANTSRIISAKELAELNKGKIPYYIEAATRSLLVRDNYKKNDLETHKNNLLFYELPTRDLSTTLTMYDINYKQESPIEEEQAAFITDESLCYLDSDGMIRVRGLVAFKYILPDEEAHFSVYCEVVLGIIPEATKKQQTKWQFGDFFAIDYVDLLQIQNITKDEYNALLEKYNVTPGIPELPKWAGVYGIAE